MNTSYTKTSIQEQKYQRGEKIRPSLNRNSPFWKVRCTLKANISAILKFTRHLLPKGQNLSLKIITYFFALSFAGKKCARPRCKLTKMGKKKEKNPFTIGTSIRKKKIFFFFLNNIHMYLQEIKIVQVHIKILLCEGIIKVDK